MYTIDLTEGKLSYVVYDTEYVRIPMINHQFYCVLYYLKRILYWNIPDGNSIIFASQKTKIIHLNLCEYFIYELFQWKFVVCGNRPDVPSCSCWKERRKRSINACDITKNIKWNCCSKMGRLPMNFAPSLPQNFCWFFFDFNSNAI